MSRKDEPSAVSCAFEVATFSNQISIRVLLTCIPDDPMHRGDAACARNSP